MKPLIEIVRAYRAAGLSVLPIRADGSKSPALGSWSEYQHRLPTEAEIAQWFSRPNVGVAIIGGAVSGNLERLDFDRPRLYEEWRDLVHGNGLGAEEEQCVLIQTPTGGAHLYFRVDGPAQDCEKLAREETGKTIIETKSEGGYCLAPGCPTACHPTGKTYDLLRGSLDALPVLSEEMRDFFKAFAHYFDAPLDAPIYDGGKPVARATDGEHLPGQDYNERGDFEGVLEAHGWQRAGHSGGWQWWRRPGKAKGGISAKSGVYEGRALFMVYSTNAAPFEGGKAYSPFAVYALLEHDGGFSSAAAALYAEGFGDRAIAPKQGRRIPAAEGEIEPEKAVENDPEIEDSDMTKICDFEMANLPHMREICPPEKDAENAPETEPKNEASVEPEDALNAEDIADLKRRHYREYNDTAAWTKRGRQLKREKARFDEEMRWALGFWAAGLDGLRHGKKYRFIRELFGEAAQAIIKHYEPTAKAWLEEGVQEGVPFSIHEDLNASDRATRLYWCNELRRRRQEQSPMSREDFAAFRDEMRQAIGRAPSKRPPTGWRVPATVGLDERLGERMGVLAERMGTPEFQRQLRAFLDETESKLRDEGNEPDFEAREEAAHWTDAELRESATICIQNQARQRTEEQVDEKEQEKFPILVFNTTIAAKVEEPPTGALETPEEPSLEELRLEWRRAWNQARLAPLTANLASRILGRPVQSVRAESADWSFDDWRRLIHFAEKGEMLDQTPSAPELRLVTSQEEQAVATRT